MDFSNPAMIEILGQLKSLLVGAASRGNSGTDQARVLLARYEPLIARTLRDSLLASWLDAARSSALEAGLPNRGGPPPFDPTRTDLPDPVVRLPLIDEAVRDLTTRQVLDRQAYDQLDQDARRVAFTVARMTSLDAVNRFRDELTKNIEEGGTLKDFQARLGAKLDGAWSSQVETAYRTHTAQAYAAGQKAILEDPLVADAFPYLLFSATHDSRVRPDHLEMESHGPGGLPVYRADDPIWESLYPPMAWNCRCVVVPISLADAARLGSAEASEWLRTGNPPINPQFAGRPYPVQIPSGWPTHRRIETVL